MEKTHNILTTISRERNKVCTQSLQHIYVTAFYFLTRICLTYITEALRNISLDISDIFF